jgi:hypothetical protein
MVKTHSKNHRSGYVDEKVFDGGYYDGAAKGDVAYDEDEPVRTTAANSHLALIPHNLWLKENQDFPTKEYLKETLEIAGQDVSTKKEVVRDLIITPGKKSQHVQNTKWIERAIGVATSGYQEVGLMEKLGTTATGLAATTQYYFKVNVDGGGVVEYDITTGTDVTYTAVIALIDAEVTAAGITPSLYAGDLRFTSDSTGATSTIALSAGTTGTDLFATLTGWVVADGFNIAHAGKAARTAGTVPNNSWTEINYDGAKYRGAYGCYVTEYKLILNKTDTPKEEIIYPAVNVKTVTDANLDVAVHPNYSEVAKKHSDFTVNCQAALEDWESITLTITCKYTEKGGGVELHKYPKLIKVDWEIEVSTYDYNSTLLGYTESATESLFTCTIAGWGKTLTLTNMHVKPESTNEKEVPEKGMKLYTYTCEIGGKSVASLA